MKLLGVVIALSLSLTFFWLPRASAQVPSAYCLGTCPTGSTTGTTGTGSANTVSPAISSAAQPCQKTKHGRIKPSSQLHHHDGGFLKLIFKLLLALLELFMGNSSTTIPSTVTTTTTTPTGATSPVPTPCVPPPSPSTVPSIASSSATTTGTSSATATDTVPGIKPGQQPLALIFDKPPLADDGDAQGVADMLQKSPYKFKTELVGPGHTALTAQVLQQASLFVEPGGEVDTSTAKTDFATEIPLVNQWVSNGGRYLGICAGGFVAGKEGYGVFPGEVGSYVGSPNATAQDQSDQPVQITWQDGKTYSVDFQDGNYFQIPAGTQGVTVLGKYNTGLPAAAVATFGKGKSAFTGPHFESASDNGAATAHFELDNQLLDVLMK